MKKLVFAAVAVAMLSVANAEQNWGPMPYPTPVNEPTIRDFIQAAQMIDKTSAEPAYIDMFAKYRMCTELALRALVPHRIDPVRSMIYTAVRGCTWQMDNYVLLFVQDERFKANYYVAHAIQRIAQQEQQAELLPLAERIRLPAVNAAAPGAMGKIKSFLNINQQPKQDDKN
jgi:hypothetical protein